MTMIIRLCVYAVLTAAFGAAAAADASSRNLRLGYILPETHPQGAGARKIAELAAQKSGGKIKIQTFGNGVLGDELKMAAAVQGGVLDLLIVTTSPVAGIVKELEILDIPFLFNNTQEVDAVLEGPVGAKLLEKMEPSGMVGLGWAEAGFRNITNSRRPLMKAEDLGGLKFRTMQSKAFLQSFTALGANPVPLAFTELFTALETKAVDGAEAPTAVIEANKWYEVQKYLTITRHAFASMVIVASKKVWDRLSADERRVLREAVIEGGRFERAANREQEQKALESLKAKGMVVNELTGPELVKLRAKVQPVADSIAKDAGEDLVKEMYREIAKVRK